MTDRRCCGFDVCPYGHLSWILPVVTFFATWFFLFPAFRCSLTVSKSVGGDFEIWYGYWNLESSEFALALGPEEDSNVCIKWGDGDSREIFDSIWKLGKSIGVIGSFTTIPVAFLNCVLFWSRLDLGWFYPLIGVHVLNAFFSFMLLVGLRSELCEAVDCILARAGYVAIVAGFLWLFAAFLLYLVRKKEAEMSTNPNGVDFKDIEADKEEMLALPAPEEERLALPAPDDSPQRKKKAPKAPSSREVPLALPPSESAAQKETPKSNLKNSVKKSPVPSSNRTSATAPESPRPSSSRTNMSKSPRKGTRASDTPGSDGRPSTPRKSSTKSPKKGGSTTPTSAGTKKKKKKAATKPDDIPEI